MKDKKLKKKVLIVEDEKTIAKNISDFLLNFKYKVFVAKDGLEALNIFEVEEIDMIILDLMLPKMSGEEICRKIRIISKVPIIMLTAKTMSESKIHCLDIGADIYLTKPFSLIELNSVIKIIV